MAKPSAKSSSSSNGSQKAASYIPPSVSVPLEQFHQFIHEIQEISSQTEAIDVAYTVIHETHETLKCDRSSFFFVDGDYLDLVIAKGVDSIRLPKKSGFAGQCATDGCLVNIPDAYQNDIFDQRWDKKNEYRTKQVLCYPIIDTTEHETIGVLQCINTNNDQPFDEIAESLIKCLANQIATAMRFAIQMEEAKQAQSQKEALISYIRNMNANTNVPSLLFTLNKAAQQLLEADRCTFYTINHLAEKLHLINTDSAVDIVLAMSQGIAGTVATTARKVNIPNCYADKRFDPSWDKQTGYKTVSMLVMPVFADVQAQRNKEKPIAVVQLINKQKGEAVFNNTDEELLDVLLRFVGPLIKSSSLFKARKSQKLGSEHRLWKDLKAAKMKRLPSQEFCLESLDATIEEEEDGEEEDHFRNDDQKASK